jgi:hypothetical protein
VASTFDAYFLRMEYEKSKTASLYDWKKLKMRLMGGDDNIGYNDNEKRLFAEMKEKHSIDYVALSEAKTWNEWDENFTCKVCLTSVDQMN